MKEDPLRMDVLRRVVCRHIGADLASDAVKYVVVTPDWSLPVAVQMAYGNKKAILEMAGCVIIATRPDALVRAHRDAMCRPFMRTILRDKHHISLCRAHPDPGGPAGGDLDSIAIVETLRGGTGRVLAPDPSFAAMIENAGFMRIGCATWGGGEIFSDGNVYVCAWKGGSGITRENTLMEGCVYVRDTTENHESNEDPTRPTAPVDESMGGPESKGEPEPREEPEHEHEPEPRKEPDSKESVVVAAPRKAFSPDTIRRKFFMEDPIDADVMRPSLGAVCPFGKDCRMLHYRQKHDMFVRMDDDAVFMFQHYIRDANRR
jgi:hypothetical protein